MKKIKMLVIFAFVMLTAVACGEKMTADDIDGENQFTYVDNGGFYVNNEGKAVPSSEAEGKKIVEWYTEPLCPYCLRLDAQVSPYLYDIQGEDTLIKYMPLSFIGKTGVEGEITYSDRMTAIWFSMAENDPDMVAAYKHLTATEDFINDIQNAPDQNLFMEEAYTVTLEGEKWDEIEADLETFLEVSRNATEYSRRNKELASKIPGGSVVTPTLYVQGEDEVVNLETENLRTTLEEVLK